MGNQRTSATKPVSDGLARELGRMFEDAARKYSGGTQKAELVKGNPDLIKRTYQLWDELSAERTLRLPIAERPIWKTVQLGTGPKTVKDFIKVIEEAGGKVSDWSKNVMDKPAFTVATEPTDLDLVIMTVAELGFPDGAKLKDIFAKAKSFGLELCPAEVGPQLRLQYMDQPKNKWLLVAMEPITDSDGGFFMFSVERDDIGWWLRIDWGRPDNRWGGSRRFVFCRRK